MFIELFSKKLVSRSSYQFLIVSIPHRSSSRNMARRSGGGRSARPASRAAPMRNPPAPASRAPPPAHAPAQGGGMLSGIGSTIAQGMAFGTGSAMAHRAVDAVMGPRTIQHEMAANESPAASVSGADACNIHSKAFQDCVNNFGSDISKCQFYMDMLAECKRNSGSMMST